MTAVLLFLSLSVWRNIRRVDRPCLQLDQETAVLQSDHSASVVRIEDEKEE